MGGAAAMSGGVEVDVLGPLAVRVAGSPIALTGHRRRSLLARLALAGGQPVDVDRLVEDLWPDDDPVAAAGKLHVQIARLRRLLEPERAPGAPSAALVTEAGGYRLLLPAGGLDAARFERLLEAGRTALAGGRADDAHGALTQALALWRGPALADVAGSFAANEASRLGESRLRAIEALADAALAMGRHAEVVVDLEGLVAEHPLREAARARLMLTLYRSGRQAEALRSFQELRRHLRDGLGIDPSPELVRLEAAILRQDRDLAWPPADPVDPRPDDRPAAASALRAGEVPRTVGAGASPSQEPLQSPFVGRDDELALMLTAAARLATGRGGVVLVSGEPGIGKTRLATELATATTSSATVTWGRCWEGTGAPPFWPWVELLRAHLRSTDATLLRTRLGVPGVALLARLVPEVGERCGVEPAPIDDDGARFRLYDTVTEVLVAAAAQRPQLIILEDLHWADLPSIHLLAFVAQRTHEVPLLIVGTFREREVAERVDVGAVLLQTSRHGSRLRLAGLAQPAVARLLSPPGGHEPERDLVEQIWEATGGNPLFVTEYASVLADRGPDAPKDAPLTVPPGIQDVIRWRLQPLADDDRAVLEAAAIAGQHVDARLVADVLGRSVAAVLAALDRCLLHGPLTGADRLGTYRFSHEVVRQTIEQQLSTARRASLHQAVGDALLRQQAGSSVERAAEIAHHFLAALPLGDLAQARQHAVLAAERASEQLAFEDAAYWYGQALETGPDDPVTTAELLLRRSEARWRSGDLIGSTPGFHDAATAARRAQSPVLLARAALGIGGGHIVGPEFAPRDVELMEEAADALAEDDPLRVRLLARLAGVYVYRAERPPLIERGFRYGEEALTRARRSGDPELLTFALFARHFTLDSPQHDDVRPALALEMLAVADELASTQLSLWAWGFRAFDLLHLGHSSEARDALETSLGYAVKLGQPFYLAAHRSMLGVLDLFEGRFEDAAQHIAESIESFDALQAPVFRSLALSAQLELQRCCIPHHDTAASPEAGGEEVTDPHPLYRVLNRALRHARLDDEALRSTVDVLTAWRQGPWASYALGYAAQQCADLRDEPSAVRLYDEMRPYAGRLLVAGRPPMPVLGSGSLHLAVLAGVVERFDEAEQHFRQALEHHERMASPPWTARTLHRYAEMLLRRDGPGDRDRGRAMRDAAIATAETIGMHGLLAMACELDDR